MFKGSDKTGHQASQQHRSCPYCHSSMSWIPQYQAWYCHNCRRYTKPMTQQTPTCPICRQPALYYSHAYKRWYCNNCKKYPEWPIPYKEQVKRSEQMKEQKQEGETVIEDLFLLYNDGRLIKHYTRRLKPSVDSDILSSMLAAVQEFVKESFTQDDEGELEEIKIGKTRIYLQKGQYISIAVLIEGEDTEGIGDQVKRALGSVEQEHVNILQDWDGDLSTMKPLNDSMNALISGKYAQ